jgi:hypothetical protein
MTGWMLTMRGRSRVGFRRVERAGFITEASGGGQSTPRSYIRGGPSSRKCAQLPRQGVRVFNGLPLRYFSITHTKNVDAHELQTLPGRRDAPEFAPMCASADPSGHDPVLVDNHIIVRESNIGERGPHRRDCLSRVRDTIHVHTTFATYRIGDFQYSGL